MGDFVWGGSGAGSNNLDLTGTTFCSVDLACHRDVILNNVTKTNDDEIIVSLQYKSSQAIIGYQFVLSFDTAVANPTAISTFTFTETTAAVSFTKLEQLYDGGKFVITGTFTNSSTLIPISASATNFLDITINQTGVFTDSELNIEAATSILKTNNNQNSITNPNPIFAYWNAATSGAINNNFWTGSDDGQAVPGVLDYGLVRERIKKIYGAQVLFDISASSGWKKELDTRLKGWFDVTDLCSIDLYLEDTSRTNLLVDYICEEEMVSSAECDDCACPDELESLDSETCKSEVFISNITLTKGTEAIITLSYRSSCCIDGYDVTLGNLKPRADYDFPGGIKNILNLQDQEPVQREWIEDVGIDPTFTPLEFLTNGRNHELVYPRAFGFSFGSALNAYEADGKDYGASDRTGAWCIPSTNGAANILTRFVVNLDSFDGLPTIEKFRLVTNDELVSPCSFDTDGNPPPCEITWTGIDLNEEIGSSAHATVKYEDLQACLYYLKTGLGASETAPFDVYNTYVEKFISELGRTELDIVDVLTVANHIAIEGNNQASNPDALIVPKDCCVCTLPGDFTLGTVYNDCSDPDNPGTILVEFNASSDADGYKVYRRSRSVRNPSPSDFAISTGLAENNLITQDEFVFTELELIETRSGVSSGGVPSTNPIYDKPKLAVGCCDDQHTVEYIVVAFNKCGEVSKTSTITDYQCCDITPTANNIEIIRPVNSITSGFFPVDYAPAPAPFGTCTDDANDCKGLTFIVRSIDVPGGNLDYSGLNTGKYSYQPPLNYVGPVVLTYEVYTETECSASGTITIKYAPDKVSLDTKALPCGSEDHGKVFLSWNNPTGNYLSFVVQRRLSGDPTFADVVDLDFTDYYGLDTVSYVDGSITIDECCSADLVYDYRVAVVGLIGENRTNLQFGSSRTIHTFSFESEVTIPCCSVNNVTNLASIATACGIPFGSVSHPATNVTWDEAVNAPETSHYIVYRKIQGQTSYEPIVKVVDDGSASFNYVDSVDSGLKFCNGCGTSYTVDYRVVTVDVEQTTSGDPNAVAWATGTPGDPCSEGGMNTQEAIECCPVTPCPEDVTIKICSDETKEIQLVTGCLVKGQAVVFGKDPAQIGPPNVSLVTIATDGLTTIQASYESIGTHTQDFLVVSCGQIGSATLTIEIVDCGCYCADNEAEYIICDNDTYNADIANSPGKTVDQVPFSISIKRSHPKGSQEPYVLARGTVLCIKPT